MSDPIKEQWIVALFSDEPSTLERGKKFISSNKIRHFQHFFGQIAALVDGSFHDDDSTAHWVEARFQVGVGFTSTSCQCTRGAFKCSHLAALLLFAKDQVSKTDVPVVKQYPRALLTHKPAKELFHNNNQTSISQANVNITTIHSAIFEKLRRKPKPIIHVLKTQLYPSVYQLPLKPTFPSFLELLAAVKASNQDPIDIQKEVKQQVSAITPNDIETIAAATIDQRKSPYWMQYRIGIITGSNMRYAMQFIEGNRKVIRKDWIEKVAYGKTGYLSEAMQYGIDHESVAINVFKKMTGNLYNMK